MHPVLKLLDHDIFSHRVESRVILAFYPKGLSGPTYIAEQIFESTKLPRLFLQHTSAL